MPPREGTSSADTDMDAPVWRALPDLAAVVSLVAILGHRPSGKAHQGAAEAAERERPSRRLGLPCCVECTWRD
ncbi:hypothetical protein MTO96_004714 [Rhipicephalus appendiculatus]